MKKTFVCFLMFFVALPSLASAERLYEIQIALSDKFLLINDKIFTIYKEAVPSSEKRFDEKNICLGWKEGEFVVFIEGDPHGLCGTSLIYNLNREETCRVLCD